MYNIMIEYISKKLFEKNKMSWIKLNHIVKFFFDNEI